MTKEELKENTVAKIKKYTSFEKDGQSYELLINFTLDSIDQAYQAGQEAERERCIKIIKEMGLHLGYANNVITRINQPNQH